MQKITKLVLPVAGMGKRLLPLTKRTPKNLIKVNKKPLLEYVLEEAVASGIREIILIVNPSHRKHFERYINTAGKKRFPTLRFFIREQATPGGNGHAIIQAYDLVHREPFAVRFCDDIIVSQPPVLQGLLDLFHRYQSPFLLLERVPKSLVSRFGVVAVKKVCPKIFRVTKIVEKPKAAQAPSNLTIVGGYVLTPHIIRNLKMVADTLPVIADDALPLAVALQIELITGGRVYGWEFKGKRLDCGTLQKLQKVDDFLRKQS